MGRLSRSGPASPMSGCNRTVKREGRGSGPRQALLQREEHQLAPMVEVELVADVAHVVAHRLRADGAVTGDLLCASTARDPGEDVPFALAQSRSGGKAPAKTLFARGDGSRVR